MKKLFYFSIFLFAVDPLYIYAQSGWTQKADFGGPNRSGSVAFSIGNKGYIATGGDVVTGLTKDLWEYDPTTDIWTQKADLGGLERSFAVGFAIGDFGYVGTGNGNGADPMDDFWQYDPVANTWTEKAEYPGGKRQWAVGFSIGNKGYIGTGTNQGFEFRNDFYEYDPATNTWTQKANVGGEKRAEAVGFSIGNKGYIGTGAVETTGFTNDFWEYDPATDSWTEKAEFPGEGQNAAVGFGIGTKGYIGTGLKLFGVPVKSFWEYDQLTDTWMEKESLPVAGRQYAVGFAINGKGYIGTGKKGNDVLLNDFYEFTPGCATPTGLTITNIKATTARLNWAVEPSAQSYSVRYRKTGTITWTKTTATTNFKKLAGLTLSTQYDWSVKSVCDQVNNISSDWSSTQNFTTKPLRLEDGSEEEISLQVYPNPFTSSATISFLLTENENAVIEIFDVAGRKTMLLNETLQAGDHELILLKEQISAGVFLVKLITRNETSVIKIIVQ